MVSQPFGFKIAHHISKAMSELLTWLENRSRSSLELADGTKLEGFSFGAQEASLESEDL